ncbi:MAG TPA: MipA/OmpV family protein [Noviherbaspirillum sp.]|jgi:outer membrane scaffolding protein for murein synthesis (MipA/OmpV family)|uniref:MipA/OmpV family protein n=1 Tax=Noviherbaspirillum sp. TaxID=1926288 RepID=UPI002DDD1DCE|nr:MipA/OmpV family protein [Noviherbaspirillum sp.]HEV2608988.1 MipA/OmpV family protein [Noviherbaspirillum sp.]
MKNLFLLALLGTSSLAIAQTPTARLMPDGSKDMYAGIGITSAPRYRGSDRQETDPVALVQVQWSNGIFVSGLSAGMHLSASPTLEFGPLLAIEPGRNASGAQKLSGIGGIGVAAPGADLQQRPRFTDVGSALQGGAFLNRYLDENLRLTSSVLYGAGNDRNGLLLNAGIQKFIQVAPHHAVTLSAGATWANRRYTQDYFGVDGASTAGPDAAAYRPSGGIRDLQFTVNWNWELSNLWLLTSQLSLNRLMGPAADSPLTDRRNNATVRTGLVYRF